MFGTSNKPERGEGINLGDKARDTVTGFEGIVVAQHTYLHGCKRMSIQPPMDKEGTVPDAVTFDEPQLEIVVRKEVPIGSRNTGGPEKYMPQPRVDG